MKKSTIQVAYPTEKLDAIRHYCKAKDIDLSGELEGALHRLYEKHVPKDVRGFLEMRVAAERGKPDRPPRPTRPATSPETANREP